MFVVFGRVIFAQFIDEKKYMFWKNIRREKGDLSEKIPNFVEIL